MNHCRYYEACQYAGIFEDCEYEYWEKFPCQNIKEYKEESK